MKIVAVIPMKLNNVRLANKNTKLLENGKPLCSYIFDTVSKVRNIDEIYVYCSDEKIVSFLPKNMKFLKRSQDLDRNTTTMNEVLRAFSNDVEADVYVLAHVTAPFIKCNTIEECINKIKFDNFDSAFTVKKVQEFLWKEGKPLNYELNNIPRTQDLPKIYAETCGLYVFKKDLIKKHNRRIGYNPYICEVDDIEATDIDNQLDFDIANYIIKKHESDEV